jgi:RIP metalloprotease RseP
MDVFSSLFSSAWSVVLVILFFGGSIFIHELGHFLAAKWRGLIIERFSIGFGPKLFGWSKDGIDYRVSLFPLGGYVALPQLADMGAVEGKSKKDVKSLPPITYTDKVIVAVMGAVFNVIFAAALAVILWFTGQPSSSEQLTTTVGYVSESIQIDEDTEVAGPAKLAGILPGDTILKVDGDEVDGFKDIEQLVVTGSGRSEAGDPQVVLTVDRNGSVMDLTVNPVLMQFNRVSGERMRVMGISPKQDLIIGQALEGSPAAKAGIIKGDVLISADGVPLYSLKTLNDRVNENPQKAIDLVIKRQGEKVNLNLKPELIPYTKPVGLVMRAQGGSMKFMTLFNKEPKQDPADPSSKGQIVLLEAEDIDDVSIGSVLKGIDSLEHLNRAIATGVTVLKFGDGSSVEVDKGTEAKILEPRTQALIGVQLVRQPKVIHVNPITQFKDNIDMTFRALGSLLSTTSDLNVSHLMGPPGIIRTIYTFSTIDFRLLIWLIILININLAILNLLPVPVLDGGHILFATIGKLRGRPLNGQFIATLQGMFMLLLFSLMIYVSFFDVRRWQGDKQLEEKIKLQQQLYIPTEFKK